MPLIRRQLVNIIIHTDNGWKKVDHRGRNTIMDSGGVYTNIGQ